MVNYTDRPGSYRYDAARPDARFNPKLMKLSLKALPIILLFNLLHHKYNGVIKNIVESSPYWEKQVIYTQRKKHEKSKAGFDMLIETHSKPPSVIKYYSAF